MIRRLVIVVVSVIALAGCRDSRAPMGGGAAAPTVGPGKAADLSPADLEVQGPGLHKLQVQAPTGKTIKYAVHVPDGLPKGVKAPLVVALHYAGKDSDWYGHGMVVGLYADGCMPIRPIIVAPDSLSGDDWDTAVNVDHVAWLTRSVLKSYPIDPKKVVLSGFSAGGIGAWYIAPRVPDLFTAAIPIAGEPTLKGSEWTLPVCAIHAEADSVIRSAATKQKVEALKGAGKPANLILLTDGTTHYDSGRHVPALRQACGWLHSFVWK